MKPHLPQGDEVLAFWYKYLNEFKKDLPLLHKLSNDALKVSDAQLLQARAALKESYTEQQEMFQAMRSGAIERDEIREKMLAMRGKILTQISAVLDEDQVEALKKHMASQRGGRGGRGERGGRGGRGPADATTD